MCSVIPVHHRWDSLHCLKQKLRTLNTWSPPQSPETTILFSVPMNLTILHLQKLENFWLYVCVYSAHFCVWVCMCACSEAKESPGVWFLGNMDHLFPFLLPSLPLSFFFLYIFTMVSSPSFSPSPSSISRSWHSLFHIFLEKGRPSMNTNQTWHIKL